MSIRASQGHSPGWKSGEHKAVCDRCGFDYIASTLKKEWNNLYVCDDCWEIRHPQDFVRGKTDKIVGDWPRRPDPEPIIQGTESQPNDPNKTIPPGTFNNDL